MTFMEALKKFGPIASLAAGPYAPLVLAGIAIAEESGKKGSDKKKIAVNAARASAVVVNALKQERVINPDAAADITASVVDEVVAAVNELKDVDKLPVVDISEALPVEINPVVTAAKVSSTKK